MMGRTREEILAAINKDLDAYNKAKIEGKISEYTALEGSMSKDLDDLRAIVTKECFIALLGTEHPLETALRQFIYGSYRFVDEKPGDDDIVKVPTRKLVPFEAMIDFTAFDRFAREVRNVKLADGPWRAKTGRLAKAAAVATSEGLEAANLADIKSKYKLSREAAEMVVDITTNGELSKKKMLAVLREVVADMGLDDKIKLISRDVNFVLNHSTGKGKAIGGTKFDAERPFVQTVMRMLHCELTGEPFTVETKLDKK